MAKAVKKPVKGQTASKATGQRGKKKALEPLGKRNSEHRLEHETIKAPKRANARAPSASGRAVTRSMSVKESAPSKKTLMMSQRAMPKRLLKAKEKKVVAAKKRIKDDDDDDYQCSQPCSTDDEEAPMDAPKEPKKRGRPRKHPLKDPAKPPNKKEPEYIDALISASQLPAPPPIENPFDKTIRD